MNNNEPKEYEQDNMVPTMAAEQPYTMEEIDAMLEESERDFEAGRCYSTEQVLQMCRKAQTLSALRLFGTLERNRKHKQEK